MGFPCCKNLWYFVFVSLPCVRVCLLFYWSLAFLVLCHPSLTVSYALFTRSERFYLAHLTQCHFFFSDGPVFTKKPSEVHAYKKSSVQFECQAEGIPKPNISWSLNGRELSTSSYTRVGDGVLVVQDIVFSDKGVYQCFAKGYSGKVQASGQLFVYYEGKDQFPF